MEGENYQKCQDNKDNRINVDGPITSSKNTGAKLSIEAYRKPVYASTVHRNGGLR